MENQHRLSLQKYGGNSAHSLTKRDREFPDNTVKHEWIYWYDYYEINFISINYCVRLNTKHRCLVYGTPASNLEVPCSNLGLKTGYPEWDILDILLSPSKIMSEK